MAGVSERIFTVVAHFGFRRRALVLALAVVACLLAGTLIPGLRVSTSRYGLVSEENPYQARLIRFYQRFGYPDTPLLVISGGTPQMQREVVDRLERELEQVPELEGRVLARLRSRDIAEVLLVNLPPETLTMVGDDPSALAGVVEGGLPAWLAALEKNLYTGLEGPEGGQAGTDFGTRPQPEAGERPDVSRGMQRLANIAAGLNGYLGGEDGADTFSLFDEGRDTAGLDEQGYFSTEDGARRVITLLPDLPGDEVAALEPLVRTIRAVRDDVMSEAPAGIVAELTGLPALAVDELAVLERGLLESSVASAIGIFVLVLALFRSLRQTIIGLIPLLVGVVLTLATVRVLYGELNLITSSFVAVLLGLGIDFSVHVLSRANEELRRGTQPAAAAAGALVGTGPGIVTGTVATALAFLTTTTTEFTAYAELGVITAIGVTLIMAATFLLLPALSGLVGRRSRPPPDAPGFHHVPPLVRRWRHLFWWTGVVLGIAGAFGLPRISFNPRYFDFLPATTESAAALDKLEYDPVMSPVFANLVAKDVQQAREMTARLRQMDEVAGVQSATDLLPPLTPERLTTLRNLSGTAPDFGRLRQRGSTADEVATSVQGIIDALDEVRFAASQGGLSTDPIERAKQAFASLHATLTAQNEGVVRRLARIEPAVADVLERAWRTARNIAERGHYLPTDLPPHYQTRFVSTDGKALAIYVVPSGSFWQAEVAARFAAAVESIDPAASGLAMNHHVHSMMILRGFQRAAIISACLVFVVLLVDFRGPRDAFVALVPTVLGWLWMLGIMAAVGLRFDTANIVSLPLVLGIGIAFGVHVLHRCREGERRLGGPADLEDVIRGTGGAVMIAALTTVVGFGALMLGDYGAMKTFGLAMVIGITTCLLASILVLPSLLVILGRAR